MLPEIGSSSPWASVLLWQVHHVSLLAHSSCWLNQSYIYIYIHTDIRTPIYYEGKHALMCLAAGYGRVHMHAHMRGMHGRIVSQCHVSVCSTIHLHHTMPGGAMLQHETWFRMRLFMKWLYVTSPKCSFPPPPVNGLVRQAAGIEP